MAVYKLQEIQYDDEAAFGEVDPTYTKRIPVLEATLTLGQDRESDLSLQSRLNESRPGFLGTKSAELSLKTYFCGYGASTSGAISATWLGELLGDALGGLNVAATGCQLSASQTVSTIVISNTSGWAVGHALRIGTKADGRGDGQASIISGITGNTLNLRASLPTAPTSGDIAHAMQAVTYSEAAAAATKRFMCGWTATGAQYHLHGTDLSGLTIDAPIGQLPTVTMKWRGANWVRTAYTVPTNTNMESADVAPVAGGSVVIQTAGTATRQIVSPSAMTLDLDLQLADKIGPAAANAAYQVINGYERMGCKPKLSVTIPWSTTLDTYDTDGSSSTHYHILATLNATDGRSVVLWLPRAYLVSPRPIVTESNGLLYQTFTFMGREGSDTSTELARSAIGIFMG